MSSIPFELRNHTSPKEFAQVALTLGLVRAQSAKAYVTKVAEDMKEMKAKEYPVVKDCLEQIKDGVDQISQSIKELKHIDEDGDDNFVWHMSSVQTWLSTAMTDAMICIDGFSGHAVGGKTKATIKAKVLNVAQVTSNALALFNRFAARHRAKGSTTKP